MTAFRRVCNVLAVTALSSAVPAGLAQPDPAPLAVRNDVPQPGEEVLVLRHQKLRAGGHEAYFRLSREGVWPWFEKIGSRIVGQWKVIYPDGAPSNAAHEDGYRLARYASYEHWQATRQGQRLGGNGPDYRQSRAALRERTHYAEGSDGAYFLQGATASTRVYFMPGVDESYEPVEAESESQTRPVRNDRNWPAPEIVALVHWKIAKGEAEAFIAAGQDKVWPYLEKVGARVVGRWRAVYPPESGFPENPAYDEVLEMVRYAGYEHWKAARPQEIAAMGGDGPDYDAYREALELQETLSSDRSVLFLQGYMYHSPPKFLPGLGERYRKSE